MFFFEGKESLEDVSLIDVRGDLFDYELGSVNSSYVKREFETPEADISDFDKSLFIVASSEFSVDKGKDGVKYSCDLSEFELEMLRACKGLTLIDKLRYSEQGLWSEGQADKLMKNLYGFLEIFSGAQEFQPWYQYVSVDSRTYDGYKRTGNDFYFEGKVSECSIPVLRFIYDRSVELKEKYGNNFFPKFSCTEVSNNIGISKKRVSESFDDLAGVVVPYFQLREHCYVEKPFLSTNRMRLAEKILEVAG